MRINMTLDDRLMQHAQDRARQRGQSLGEIVESSLRRELAREVPLPTPTECEPTWELDLRSVGQLAGLFVDENSPRA